MTSTSGAYGDTQISGTAQCSKHIQSTHFFLHIVHVYSVCVCVCVCSTVLRFSVQGPEGPVLSPELASVLRGQLLREKTDYLLFRVLRVDTVSEYHNTEHHVLPYYIKVCYNVITTLYTIFDYIT